MSISTNIFTKVLGLDAATTKKVSAMIRASGSGSQIQDGAIRRRMGSQAFTLLNKGIDASNNDTGTPDEDDKSKKSDGEDKKMNETFTLTSFLVQEAVVDVDLSSPQAAVADARNKARLATDPNRLDRSQMQDAKDAKTAASKDEGPGKALKMQIARKQQELVMLNKRLRQIEKNSGPS